jgi:MFS family permease
LPAFVLFIVSGSVVGFGLAYFCRGAYLVAWSTMYAALGEMTPERLRSRSFALAELLGGAGFGIAPFIAGALYESSPSLPIVVSLIAIVPLLGLILLARRYIGQPTVGLVPGSGIGST